jgi:hypothetical protein
MTVLKTEIKTEKWYDLFSLYLVKSTGYLNEGFLLVFLSPSRQMLGKPLSVQGLTVK